MSSIRAKRRDVEKEKYWRGVIREGARSGLSIREFCRQKRIKESQFYAWRRELKYRDEEKGRPKRACTWGRASRADWQGSGS